MVKFFKIFSTKKKNPKKVVEKPTEVKEVPVEEANRPDPQPEEPKPEDEETYKGYFYSNYQGPYTQIFNTPNQWKQCIDIFNNMDEDGDETIDDNEMWQAVMKVGQIRQIECGRKKFSMRSFNSIFNEFQEFIKTNGMKFTTFLDICQNMCVAVESWPPKFEDYEYYVEDENMFRAYFTFFQEMDSDGDNKVSEKELKQLFKTDSQFMNNLGPNGSGSFDDNNIEYLLKEVDHNYDGFLQFSEFIILLTNPKNPEIMFNVYDKDNNGLIDFEEFSSMINSLLGKREDLKLSDEVIKAKFEEFCSDGCDSLNFVEVKKALISFG